MVWAYQHTCFYQSTSDVHPELSVNSARRGLHMKAGESVMSEPIMARVQPTAQWALSSRTGTTTGPHRSANRQIMVRFSGSLTYGLLLV